MKVSTTRLADVLLVEPPLYRDERGFFCESFNQHRWQQATGLDITFVQDNHSHSKRGVLRGIHYQLAPHAQGKLVHVLQGSIFTVAVDLRRSSPQFGQHLTITLHNQNHLWIPPGFGHGFLALSDTADYCYKTTDYYTPDAERSIIWNDPTLAIKWPLEQAGVTEPLLSDKDKAAVTLDRAEVFI